MAKEKNIKAAAAHLFFRSFLKGMVVLLALVIIGLGTYLGIEIYTHRNAKEPTFERDESVFADGKVDELLTAEPTEASTQSIYETDFNEIDFSVGINVLNATETSGLAGYWTDKLKEKGYTNVNTADSSTLYEKTRIVVTEEGIASELKEVFPKADWEVGTVSAEEMSGITEGIKVYIFIGNDYDEVSEKEGDQ